MRVTYPAILAVTLSLFGCRSTDSVVPLDASGTGRVAGKPSVVYLRVPKAFREVGVLDGGCGASFDEDGKGMTVRGKTPDGRKFAITCRQDGPDATRVGIVWDGEPDDAVGRKIVAGICRE